jgi:hypothetical protein
MEIKEKEINKERKNKNLRILLFLGLLDCLDDVELDPIADRKATL